MSNNIIKALTLPWQLEEIKWRVGALTKDKTKTKPLAYIDARTVMERLDKAVGVENWQDRYEFHGARTVCYLSIRLKDEWITKADGAGDSDIESEKGGLSDAFKRASVKWGMGRELYEMKTRWMPVDEYKQMVGDPWDFVIKNNNAPKVSKPPKEEITPEQKIHNWFIAKLATIINDKQFADFSNGQANKDARDKLYLDAPELSKKVEDAIQEKKDWLHKQSMLQA